MRYISSKWLEDRDSNIGVVRTFKREFRTRATTKEVFDWLNRTDRQHWLAWIMGEDDVGITVELLNYGANIHAFKDLALQKAVRCGHLNTVKCLIKHGADIHTNEDYVLMKAVRCGRLDIVKCLIKHGLNNQAYSDSSLQWAADWAEYHGYKKIADFIVQTGEATRWFCYG